MTYADKLIWWYLGFPACSAVHCLAAMGLTWVQLDPLGEGASPWLELPVAIVLSVLAPVLHVAAWLDSYVAVPDLWYWLAYPFSALTWWCLLTWLITSGKLRKWVKK